MNYLPSIHSRVTRSTIIVHDILVKDIKNVLLTLLVQMAVVRVSSGGISSLCLPVLSMEKDATESQMTSVGTDM